LFVSSRKATGTSYTATVALIVAALIFSPVLLLMSGRTGYGSILVAFAFSVICLLLAWFKWNRSQLTIASIHSAPPRSK
jgi:hypothetical protein